MKKLPTGPRTQRFRKVAPPTQHPAIAPPLVSLQHKLEEGAETYAQLTLAEKDGLIAGLTEVIRYPRFHNTPGCKSWVSVAILCQDCGDWVRMNIADTKRKAGDDCRSFRCVECLAPKAPVKPARTRKKKELTA